MITTDNDYLIKNLPSQGQTEMTETQNKYLRFLSNEGDEDVLRKMHKKGLTQEFFEAAARICPRVLSLIPADQITTEMCMSAIDFGFHSLGTVIEYAQKEMLTDELFTAAVNRDHQALKYIPLEKLTPELCLIAVLKNADVLEHIPETFKSFDICKTALVSIVRGKTFNHWKVDDVLAYIPKDLREQLIALLPDIYTEEVQQNGEALNNVPEELRTEALCLTAVQQNGEALRYVPEALQTEALCLEAVQQNGEALQWVSETLKTEALCLAAVLKSGYALRYVPKELLTEALCLATVQQRANALQYVPESLKTEAVCLATVQQDGWMLQSVPESLQTEAVCLAAVQQNGEALCFVSETLKTEALCLAAVQQNGEALRYVPESLNDSIREKLGIADDGDDDNGKINSEQKALAFVHENPGKFLEIPEEYRTRDVCLAAIKEKGGACEYIPEKLQSEEFFIEAVKINENGKALKYVPKEYRTKKVCEAALQYHGEALDSKELYKIGWSLYDKGEYDTGIFLLDKAIEANPENDKAWYYRGRCYFCKGDFAKAVADFKKAVELDPDVHDYKDNLAKAEAALKR